MPTPSTTSGAKLSRFKGRVRRGEAAAHPKDREDIFAVVKNHAFRVDINLAVLRDRLGSVDAAVVVTVADRFTHGGSG